MDNSEDSVRVAPKNGKKEESIAATTKAAEKSYSQVASSKDPSSPDDFLKYQQEASDRCNFRIAINTSRDTLYKEASKLRKAPFRVTRVKGIPNCWRMAFFPRDIDMVQELKRSGSYVSIGDLKVFNFHYAPGGYKVDQVKYTYSLDMQEVAAQYLGEDLMLAKLKEKEVDVAGFTKDTLYGIQTGLVTVVAVSNHKDKEIVLEFGEEKVPLERVDAKLQRRRAAKRDQAAKKENNKKLQDDNKKSKEATKKNKSQGKRKRRQRKASSNPPPVQQINPLPARQSSSNPVQLQNSFAVLAEEGGKEEIIQEKEESKADAPPIDQLTSSTSSAKEQEVPIPVPSKTLDLEAVVVNNSENNVDSSTKKEELVVSIKETYYGQTKYIEDKKSGVTLVIPSPNKNVEATSNPRVIKPYDDEILLGKKSALATSNGNESLRRSHRQKGATTQQKSGLGQK